MNHARALREDCAGLPQAAAFPIGRVRDLHELRALSHVPGADLLVVPGQGLLRHYSGGRGPPSVLMTRAFIASSGRRAPPRSIPMVQMLRDEALVAFRAWEEKPGKIYY